MKKLRTLIVLLPLAKQAWDWWKRRKNASNQSGGTFDKNASNQSGGGINHRLGD